MTSAGSLVVGAHGDRDHQDRCLVVLTDQWAGGWVHTVAEAGKQTLERGEVVGVERYEFEHVHVWRGGGLCVGVFSIAPC